MGECTDLIKLTVALLAIVDPFGSIPPAIRKEGMLMPKKRSNCVPMSAATASTQKTVIATT